MSRDKVLILGAGVLQVPAILKAKEMDLEVVVLDADRNAPGLKYADQSYLISTLDIEAAVKCALEIKPNAVLTVASDMPMRTVAAIGERLGLITISQETAMKATNKGRMREELKKYQVEIPKFFITHNYEEFANAINYFENSKCIVKPADNSGSRGVALFDFNADYKEAYEYSLKYSRSGEVLVEEYLSGPEVSVESLTIDGNTHIVAITDKLTTGKPYFIEMGHSIPSLLPKEIQNEIKNITIKAVNALGINNSPSHTEIKITEDGPKIIEIGARLGGDNITSHLVPYAKGIDMIECCIKLSLGEKIDLTSAFNKGSAIRYLQSNEGLIKGIDGLESASNFSGIKDVVFLKKPGDKVEQVKSSTDRLGYLISQADSPEEAVSICTKVIDMIKIDII